MKSFWGRILTVSLGLFIFVGPARGADSSVVELLWSQNGARLAILYSLPEGSYRLELRNHEQMLWSRYWNTATCRLVGWTPDGDLVADLGHGELEVVGEAGKAHKIVIPEDGFPVACDGKKAYFLDQRRGLLKTVGQGKDSELCSVPQGTRASGLLSPDGSRLALRRSVRTRKGWATEVLVYQPGGLKSFGSVPGGFVTLSWSPEGEALLANYPASEGWMANVLTAQGRRPLASGLASPLQWDARGRLYAADHLGLYQWDNHEKQYLATWVGSPSVWAISPDGKGVVFSPAQGRPTMLPLYGRDK